jgi:hypothetical protein
MHLPCSSRYFCQAYLSINKFARAGNRNTREGWPLMPVETELNGDPKSTNERDPSLVVCWACRAGTRDFCSALAALVGPGQNIFPRHTFFPLLYIVQQAGQAAVLGHVSLPTCL